MKLSKPLPFNNLLSRISWAILTIGQMYFLRDRISLTADISNGRGNLQRG